MEKVINLLCFTVALLLVGHIDCRPTTTTSSSSSTQEKATQNPNKEPFFLNHHPMQIMSRISRSADSGFFPPTLKNRVHGRAVRFHEGNLGPRPLGVGGNSMISGYGSPIARMMVNKDGGGGNGESETTLEEHDPTFTPYISARVFNMPQFLDHLKGNLESMTDDDFPSDEAEFDEEDFEGFGLNGDILQGGGNSDPQFIPEPKGILRWRPASFIGSRPRNRNMLHFVQQPSELESIYKSQANPGRNAYEFGLG